MSGDYFDQWYQDHREDLNEQRRSRYAEDREYAEEVRRRSRDYRKRVRSGEVNPESRSTRPVIIFVNGKRVQGYTVGKVADVVGHPVGRVKAWFRSGALPASPYHTDSGRSLFTLGMVTAIKTAMDRYGKVAKRNRNLYRTVVAAWQSLGVDVEDEDFSGRSGAEVV